MATTETLADLEQPGLTHMRKAQELGTTLGVRRMLGLDAQKLYQLRKPLVRKGRPWFWSTGRRRAKWRQRLSVQKGKIPYMDETHPIFE